MKKYLILILAFSGLISCKQKESEVLISETKVAVEDCRISISADPQLNLLLEGLVNQFLKTNKNFEICTGIENPDLYLFSDSPANNKYEDHSWKITVLREGVIPVMSDKNPYKEKILEEGIGKEMLRKAFTGKISWGELLQTNSNEPVRIFLPPQGKSQNKKWAEYLQVAPGELMGTHMNNREEIIKLLQEDPFQLGIMCACCVYDKEKHHPVNGIMAVPIDFNNNGRIDPKESHYEDLCRLERAVYLGVYPSILCNEIFLSSSRQPSDEGLVEFISWILIQGQKIAEEAGYARIQHVKANEIIKSLQTPLK